MKKTKEPVVVPLAEGSGRAWIVAILAVIVGGFIFLKSFLSVIALAALFAYLFNPIYLRLQAKFKGKDSLAVAATTLISIVVIGIPLMIVLAITVYQTAKLADSLGIDGSTFGGANVNIEIAKLVDTANKFISSTVGIDNALTTSSVTSFIKQIGPTVANAVLDLIKSLVTSIPGFITSSITYLFVFVSLLLGQKRLIETIHYLSPFNYKINNYYLKRIGLMCNAMVKGQLLIAFCQGLASALVVCLTLGIMEYFFFFLLLFTFMSIIPLGAGIITIPLGIGCIVFGEVWQGAVILLNHFLIVTNIDNYIRPKVVPKEAKLPAALTLLSAFAGVGYFGLLGVVYGPIIMIFILTTIEMYVAYRKTLESPDNQSASVKG